MGVFEENENAGRLMFQLSLRIRAKEKLLSRVFTFGKGNSEDVIIPFISEKGSPTQQIRGSIRNTSGVMRSIAE